MQKRKSDKLYHAVRSLEDTLKYARSSEFQGLGIEFKSILISAVVQNFGLTFAVCRQMITQQLIDQFGSAAVAGKSSEELLRMAAQEEMIVNLDRWLEYLDCEHLSPSSNLALRTFEKASAFLADAGVLLRTCAKRSQNERRRAA